MVGRNIFVSVVVQSGAEIKVTGGLQECAEEDVSIADAHSAPISPSRYWIWDVLNRYILCGNRKDAS